MLLKKSRKFKYTFRKRKRTKWHVWCNETGTTPVTSQEAKVMVDNFTLLLNSINVSASKATNSTKATNKIWLIRNVKKQR